MLHVDEAVETYHERKHPFYPGNLLHPQQRGERLHSWYGLDGRFYAYGDEDGLKYRVEYGSKLGPAVGGRWTRKKIRGQMEHRQRQG